MSLWRLVLKEIRHRKASFALALASIVVAVGFVVGAIVLLGLHNRQSEAIVAAKEADTQRQMKEMEDDYRKITKRMGFNVLILPKDQNLADLYADDYATKYMPESYVDRLANSKIATVRHLLPSLQQKIKWPEYKRTILLIGTRGEATLAHRDPRKPIMQPVEPGTMVVGHELHQSLGVKPGDQVRLMGRPFKVAKCHPPRGDKDDITVWVNLREAQDLLDKKGRINAILALECHCAWADLPKIRAELASVLPETQVVEKAGKALARAEARHRAFKTAQDSLTAEKAHRARLRAKRERLAGVLVPIVVGVTVVWIGFLMLTNVRERRQEIGILRAIGLRARDIFFVFVAKAVLLGLAGAVVGFLVGWAAAPLWAESGALAGEPFDLWLFGLALVVSPLVAVLASWIPATLAAAEQPAVVLRQE